MKNINRSSPHKWKNDVVKSVELYNSWFMEFAPKAFRDERLEASKRVEKALEYTNNLININRDLLKEHPEVLQILRMSTCPPIARDRLIGLAGVSKTLVDNMEDMEFPRIPPKIPVNRINTDLDCICVIIKKMIDKEIFVWLNKKEAASKNEVARAAIIIADRLCGAMSNPIIRNAQEKRQLDVIKKWLEERKYTHFEKVRFNEMKPGTFTFRTNVEVSSSQTGNSRNTNIPIDVVIMPKKAKPGEIPIMIEAKSAGDFTNVNKRRKEEAQKMSQLKNTFGKNIRYGLFLCGYFDTGYLGYEAAEGID